MGLKFMQALFAFKDKENPNLIKHEDTNSDWMEFWKTKFLPLVNMQKIKDLEAENAQLRRKLELRPERKLSNQYKLVPTFNPEDIVSISGSAGKYGGTLKGTLKTMVTGWVVKFSQGKEMLLEE